MARLSGKIAVVTGASRGIGRAIAVAFAAEGASVVLAGRNAQRLDEVARACEAAGSRAVAVPTDITQEEPVRALFQAALAQLGRVDLLVNAAGAYGSGPLDSMPLATWNRLVGVNLTGVFLCSREAMALMKRQGGGRMIHVGSLSGLRVRPHNAAYSATKAALHGLNQTIALEGRDAGITSCLIQLGAVGSEEHSLLPEDVAKVTIAIAELKPEVMLLETVVLHPQQPFVGRG